jgi:hypothetical protein
MNVEKKALSDIESEKSVWSTNPDRHEAMKEDHRNGWADYS